MTGVLQLAAGAVTTPSLCFAGSTTTGLCAAVADTLSFCTGGTERLTISAAGKVCIKDAVSGFGALGIVHNDASGNLSSSLIANADIAASAAIADTKLATISTTGKIANSATTAASTNIASAIVTRDGSGNFAAGTITAALTGAASLNLLKSGDTMTGPCQLPAGTTAAPSLRFTGSTTTGICAPTADTLSLCSGGTERININATDINLLGRCISNNVRCEQGVLVAAPTGNNQSVTTLANTSVLLLTHTAARLNFTVNFPPNPADGQLFTIVLGTTFRIGLINVGGIGGAAIVNAISILDPGVLLYLITTNGHSTTYIYSAATNSWYAL